MGNNSNSGKEEGGIVMGCPCKKKRQSPPKPQDHSKDSVKTPQEKEKKEDEK